MVVALAILLVCLSMLLIYALVRGEERRIERDENGVPPLGRRSKIN
jgi:hypothetical protein